MSSDFSGLSLENGRPKDEYSATPSGSTSAGSSVSIDVDNPAGPGTVQHPPHPPQYTLPGSQAVGGEYFSFKSKSSLCHSLNPGFNFGLVFIVKNILFCILLHFYIFLASQAAD